MTLARLLAAALVVCSLPAFAQDQQSQSSLPSTLVIEMRSGTGFISQGSMMESFHGPSRAATPAEPWRIIPDRLANFGSGQILARQFSLERPGEGRTRYFMGKGYFSSNLHSCSQPPNADATCHMVRTFMWANVQPGSMDFPSNESDAPPTCYAIRSYVVARDSNDSDSTHPVRYSTCQPAARYQLRTTEVRSGSADR